LLPEEHESHKAGQRRDQRRKEHRRKSIGH
jgi:hypothetical protein